MDRNSHHKPREKLIVIHHNELFFSNFHDLYFHFHVQNHYFNLFKSLIPKPTLKITFYDFYNILATVNCMLSTNLNDFGRSYTPGQQCLYLSIIIHRQFKISVLLGAQ